MRISEAELQVRSNQLSWLLLDVDGVLTDGGIHCHHDGTQSLVFNVKDGLALVLAQRAGLKVGLLSGRDVPVVRQRASHLKIETLMLGISDKGSEFDRFLADHQVEAEQVAYIADDLPDLPVLRRCGLSIAPLDAVEEVRQAVHLPLGQPGGHGAVRSAIEIILKSRGDWAALVRAIDGT